MGLFDKKICDICGEKIGLLGNRKLDDGNLCKDCAKKLSPWFEDRRHSTVEDIKRQLESTPEIIMFLLMIIRGILLLHGSWMSMKIRT